MYFAKNGLISTSPIDGGIEIDKQQYVAALDGMAQGKIVSIESGFAIVDPPKIERSVSPNDAMPFPQYVIGLVTEGWVTEKQGMSWLRGIVPAPVKRIIERLPPRDRFPVTARVSRASYVRRDDFILNTLAGSPDAVDKFFNDYSDV